MENFKELNLKPKLARAVEELGFQKPTDIQAQALPILMGQPTDFIGRAATGTGKTAAFGLPLLSNLDLADKRLQAIVLCPTRELAIQTAEKLSALGKYLPVRALAIYGGSNFRGQAADLRHAQVVVATPGRLLDHMTQKNLTVDAIKLVVLDEADEMISMGFKDDLEAILKNIPREQFRTWLFSATMPPNLGHVTRTYLRDPKMAQTNQKQMLSGTVRQIGYTVREQNRPQVLCKIIEMNDDFYGLVFCQTKAMVTDLTDYLRSKEYNVDCLHGDKDQWERERTLKLFRDRVVTILICTDVAARGLDVKDVTHVINYSLPTDRENYVHRIGRTGRSGKTGIAISFVSPSQSHLIRQLEHMTKTQFEVGVLPSHKDLTLKKVGDFLPRLLASRGNDKAQEILSEAWKTSLAGMSKEEIASRFLSVIFPDLFEEKERKADEEREPRRHANHRPPRPREENRRERRFTGGPRSRQERPKDGRAPGRPFSKKRGSEFDQPIAGGPMRRSFERADGARAWNDRGAHKRFGAGKASEKPHVRGAKAPFKRLRRGKTDAPVADQ